MSVKVKPTGTGITVREELHVDHRHGIGPEEEDALRKSIEGLGINVRSEARAFCEHVAGDRKVKWLEAAKRCATAQSDEEREQARAERDSLRQPDVDTPEWFAEKILEHLETADNQRAQGRQEDAARWDFQAGLTFGVAGMKFEWEDLALTGEKVTAGGKKGQEIAHGTVYDKRERWDLLQVEIDEARKLNPTTSRANVRRIVSAKTGASNSTLRRRTTDPIDRKK